MFGRTGAIVIGVLLSGMAPANFLAADELGPDGFISRAGTFRLYHGELTLRIFEAKGKLNYEVRSHVSMRKSLFRRETLEVAYRPTEPFIEKDAPWFALVESPGARSPRGIWIFDGRDRLVRVAYDPSKGPDEHWGGILLDSDARPSIVTEAPGEVRSRLPEAFKTKFEGGSRRGRPTGSF
ncbi:hypothetical protein [Aquisphaera insulae]|uniref:hypothetical protein n=1 Tax=Aquisphaera insulae TaxID=2712864 RepID=UPI0013EBBBF7|nr:hypothetical protein [Aquisphaera insulae]